MLRPALKKTSVLEDEFPETDQKPPLVEKKKIKIGRSVGIICAVLVHMGIILFGGILFLNRGQDHGTLQQVELLSEMEAEKEKIQEEPEKEEIVKEEVPDASEIIKSLETPPAPDPELQAASLSDIEAALNGLGGGDGDFASALDFSSGGRIGGVGKAGGTNDPLENAFSLGEIDQKPRPIFQTAPVYPGSMKSTEGTVSVLFVVDPKGKVINLRVEKSTNPAFEKPALDAVKQWKFEPAVKGGERVACKMRVPIRFKPGQ